MFTYFEQDDERIENYVIYALLAIAIFSRLYFYYNYNALWLDEAMLSLSIIEFNFFDFFHTPLLRLQSAPLGFMLASDMIAGRTMTIHELYFIPLISSFLQLYFSYRIIMHCFDKKFFIIYLSFFVSCYALLHYSNEFKQYSSEVAATLILIYYYIKNKNILQERVPYIIVALFIFCFLFSTYIIFIAAAIALAILYDLRTKEAIFSYCKNNKWQIIICIVFILLYYYFYLSLVSVESMQRFWDKMFIPRDIDAVLPWLHNKFISSLTGMLSLPNWAIGFLFLLGMFHLYKQKRDLFVLFLCTILVLVIASLARMFPFPAGASPHGLRLNLFWIPLLIMIVTSGIHFILEKVVRRKELILGVLILLSLVAFKDTHTFLLKGNKEQEVGRLVETINKNVSEKDDLILYRSSQAAYLAYQHMLRNKKAPVYDLLDKNKPTTPQLDSMVESAKEKQKTQLVFLFSHYRKEILKDVIEYFNDKQYPIIRIDDVGAVLLFVDLQEK